MTRLLILGGGVAGLDVASNLGRRRDLDVELVDQEPAHVWKPNLHTIAAGTSDVSVQQTSYLTQAAGKGFRFHPGEVVGIDHRARRVEVAPLVLNGEEVLPARTIGYDTLLVALGSRANDFGTPGVAEHCFTIDSRSEALRFNDKVRSLLLKAASCEGSVTVGIVGGGATGVELAGELIQFAAIAEGFGVARTGMALRVVLLNSDARLLKAFPERVSAAASRKLAELGVEIRSGVTVTSADSAGFDLADGTRVEAEIKVWAAGVRAPAVLDRLDDLERTRGGQLVVGANLVSPGDSSILAIGDCASPRLADRDRPLPATAQVAFQQAAYLGKHLPAILAGHDVPPFRYREFGSLVSLGGFDAYGSLGKFGFFGGGFIRGRVAQLGHAMLYRRHQSRLYGLRRGTLLCLADIIASRVKPIARLT